MLFVSLYTYIGQMYSLCHESTHLWKDLIYVLIKYQGPGNIYAVIPTCKCITYECYALLCTTGWEHAWNDESTFPFSHIYVIVPLEVQFSHSLLPPQVSLFLLLPSSIGSHFSNNNLDFFFGGAALFLLFTLLFWNYCCAAIFPWASSICASL